MGDRPRARWPEGRAAPLRPAGLLRNKSRQCASQWKLPIACRAAWIPRVTQVAVGGGMEDRPDAPSAHSPLLCDCPAIIWERPSPSADSTASQPAASRTPNAFGSQGVAAGAAR